MSLWNKLFCRRNEKKIVIPIDEEGQLLEGICIESEGNVLSYLIEPGSKVPATSSLIFSTAQDNQQAVAILLYASKTMSIEDSRFLIRFDAPIELLAPKKVPQIEIRSLIDLDGVFSVSSKELSTGKTYTPSFMRNTYQYEEKRHVEDNSVENISSEGENFKECLSCGKRFETYHNRCPHCGDKTSIQSLTAEEALSEIDLMKNRSKSKEFVDQGAKLFFDGNFDEAEKAFKKAIKIFPQNAPAHGNIGNILLKRGKLEEAIPWLEKALEYDPYLEGVNEALQDTKQVIKGKAMSLSEDEIEALKQADKVKSTYKKSKDNKKVIFVKKYSEIKDTVNGSFEFTYEIYKTDSEENAIEFLQEMTVSKKLYYIEVETPNGIIGKDIEGVYKT